MEKLDLKDRKILYYLDFDSRQSFRSLSRKVGLSKDGVISRVKKLQEKGIIKGFLAIIDYAKLGYSLYRFYFSFQDVSTELKKEIIDYFINNKYVVTALSLEGSYDLLVAIYVKNYPQAHSFWQNTLKKYGKYFSKRIFTAFCQEEDYANRFLLNEKKFNPTIIHQLLDGGKRVEIDYLDNQILKLISENTRLSTIDIAEALDSTSKKVHYRLKKLRELDVITAYRLQIDFSKIDYYNYKVDIELNQFDKIDNILKYIKSNPNFEYMCKTIGYVDLELGFYLNNSYQLNQIMENLSSKFPGAIKNYTYFSVMKTYKDWGVLELLKFN
jgi:DNA-binding Lrp family transcriptional regulator